MKTLFFTNGGQKYSDAVKKWLKSCYGWNENNWNENNCIIADRASYESGRVKKITFLGHFKGNEDTNMVIIVPELLWTQGTHFNAGYDVAMDLLGKRMKGKFFTLVFVSLLTRNQLRRVVSKNYKILVDVLPHLCLFESNTWEVARYSRLHFNLISRIVLNETGRLDHIIHDLEGVRLKKVEEAKEKLAEFLETLSLPVYKADTNDLDSLKDKLDNLSEANVPDLVNHFCEVAKKIMKNLGRYKLSGSEEDKGLLPYKVLAVEDDPDFQNNLKDLLEKCGFDTEKGIKVLGRETLKDIEKIVDECEEYDIILLDLLFANQNGKDWLHFNGLDLYTAIVKKYPLKVVRIMTALPRDAVHEVLAEYKKEMTLPEILTKGKGWEVFERRFKEKLPSIVRQCKRNTKKENPSRGVPVYGPFSNPVVKRWVESEITKGKKGMKEAKDYANRVWAGEEKMPTNVVPSVITEQDVASAMKIILAHRRIALAYSILSIEIDDENYTPIFEKYVKSSTRKSFGKGYFTTRLGLSFTNAEKILHENLFDFERDFVERETLSCPVKEWGKQFITRIKEYCSNNRVQLADIVKNKHIRMTLFADLPPQDIPMSLFGELLDDVAKALSSMEQSDKKEFYKIFNDLEDDIEEALAGTEIKAKYEKILDTPI